MESFYLLRDNRESGPYTVKELKTKGLFTTDLLWINGESSCWQHPTEFDALKDLATEPENKPAIVRKMQPSSKGSSDNAAQMPSSDFVYQAAFTGSESPLDNTYTSYFDEPKFSFSENVPRKKAWRKSLNIGTNLIGLATLVIGVMLSAIMVKKAVDNLENEPEQATADAKEIVAENLQEGSVHHAAMSQSTPTLDKLSSANSAYLEQAPSDSVAKAQNAILLLKKETAVKKKTTVKTKSAPAIDTPSEIAIAPVVKEVKEEKPVVDEVAMKSAARAGLQLSANEYKVGLFGGVSDLVLTVINPSSQSLDNISVEVNFLKPNGKIVGTKIVDIGNVAAGGSKTIPVPDNGRGVSVRYHVLDK